MTQSFSIISNNRTVMVMMVVVVRSIRIVNAMYDADLGTRINLTDAYRHLTTTTDCKCKLYHGRPQMLLIYLPLFRRNIQIFPNGKIQVLGRLFPSVVRSMINFVRIRLHQLLLLPPPQGRHLSQLTMTLTNLVISIQFNKCVQISQFPHSAGCCDAFYEPELFPALQINKWLPIHIAVFASGRCVITGLTGLHLNNHLCAVINNLIEFLTAYRLFLTN